ncbi:MAG: hypothetical protein ACFE85_01410 [Candidatus Hodarchaeota archaeon]
MAAPPNYVGVRTGDEYVWTPSLNAENINATGVALFGQANWTLLYSMLSEYWFNETGESFSSLAGAALKVKFTNVSDEIDLGYPTPGTKASGIYYDMFVRYNASGSFEMVTNSSYNLENNLPMGYLLDPSIINSSLWTFFFNYPFVTSKGLDYGNIATWWQAMITADPMLNTNMTVAEDGKGFKLTAKGEFLEYLLIMIMGPPPFPLGTLEDMEATVHWNDKGVLNDGQLFYGGLEIASFQLGGGIIPGYELSIVIGITGASVIGLIYVMKKKKF